MVVQTDEDQSHRVRVNKKGKVQAYLDRARAK